MILLICFLLTMQISYRPVMSKRHTYKCINNVCFCYKSLTISKGTLPPFASILQEILLKSQNFAFLDMLES